MQSWLGANPELPKLPPVLTGVVNALPERYTKAGFCFLGQTVHFPSFGAIDWNFSEHGKLWTYNLNYFEYLRQSNLDSDAGEQLIGAWITADTTHKDGWEPYPTSLRLVNWLQFYRSYQRPIPARVNTSIRRQYASLWQKVEYHLGGNHLLENAIALSTTARYLQDTKGQRKADRLLIAELEEQYLADGAHFELSVMYHLILLWRELDLFSFLTPSDNLVIKLRATLQQQLDWANYLITPSGGYPHFNDSTNGIAPAWDALQAYASALGFSHAPGKPAASTGLLRKDIHLGTDDGTVALTLWIDAAQIGPTYIPGHAHADNLSFVLHAGGQAVVVDTSISTYEKNERRAWERSTAAHNTVTVNDQNSSDVWGGFRVGRRAQTALLRHTETEVVAAHDGYAGTRHQRAFSCMPDKVIITDQLSGDFTEGAARFHFACGLRPQIQSSAAGPVVLVGGLCFTFAAATDIELFDYQCAIGFNHLADGVGVKVAFAEQLITTISV